jgi:cytochrome c553
MMLCFGGFVATAQAQPPNAAGLADGCTSCHGVNGSSVGGIPSIAGHDRAVLVSELQDFRAQKGDATIMNRIIRGYSDAEINALADYFSSTSKP